MEENGIKTPYINIQTDFGFKEVFGQEKNKKALMRFLNVIFGGKLTVNEIVYHDKEILPSEKDGKRIFYDVYATSPTKKSESSYFPEKQKRLNEKDKDESQHHFIVEMQNVYTTPYEERIVYYASKMVAGQGNAGWQYELAPVFAIAVTDFNFRHLTPKLIHDIMFVDKESGEALTDKVHIILCSLQEVPDRWEDCRTEMEEVLFLIKNMENMDNTSLAYKEGRYADIFEAARSNRVRKEDVIYYSESLEKLREYKNGMKQAADDARAQGRAEGRAEERRQSIRLMLSFGVPAEQIAEKYGMSIDEVRKIGESE